MTWNRKEHIWYRFGHALSTFLTTLFFRPKIIGKENVPKKGKLLITPNHRSMLDIPSLGCAIYRPMRFMAKKDLFKNPLVKWYFEINGSFSIDKTDSDPAAIKKAVNKLANGDAVVVFPEGKRSKEREINELLAGAGFIAIKAGAPILPVAISGIDTAIRFKFKFIPVFSKVKIVIGEPIDLHLDQKMKTSIVLQELLPELKQRLQTLYDKSLTI